MTESYGVGEAKRRFAELIERVGHGERFLISKRGRPAVALVPPDEVAGADPKVRPLGLAAVAGALADWDELEAVTMEIYASRQRARDRPAPGLS